MIDPSGHANPTHPATSHFDQRGTTYDRADVHHRIVEILANGATLEPGLSVLDVATGTGLLAFEAARRIVPGGSVLGVDISEGMIAEANRKVAGVEPQTIAFALADAERLDLPVASFDRLLCGSALVLMSDIPRALDHWFRLLKPGGIVAFDTPARPFGISGMVASIASGHDIDLGYADVADTPAKCHRFLEEAGFEGVTVRTELASTALIDVAKAIAFWDEHIDHPAWQALKEATPAAREAVRVAFVDSVMAAAIDGQLPNDTKLNFAFGRKPL